YLSGCGVTGKLLCPASSTLCTAKMTLSFETGTVVFVAFFTACECSQSGAAVARQSTSYDTARPSAGESQTSVESLPNSLVFNLTFSGGAGAEAKAASTATLMLATSAT